MTTKILSQQCPLCGKSEAYPLFVKDERSFVSCPVCSLIYPDPLPTPQESERFYQSDYYASLIERMPLIQKARIPLFQKALREFAAFRNTGKLLDIGSGMGDFLRMAQQEGWEGWGIEPSTEACETSKQWLGNRVFNQSIEGIDFSAQHFDVITMWNVIDCFANPLPVMRKIHHWLAPGGVLYIRTPNTFFHLGMYRVYSKAKSLFEKIGWKKDPSIFLTANYDAKSLKRLLHNAGFSGIRIANSELTQGDPYAYVSFGAVVSLAKSMIYRLSVFMDWITGGQLLIGSALVVKAVKGGKTKSAENFHKRVFFKRMALYFLAILGYALGLPIWSKLLGYDQKVRILLYHSVDFIPKGDLNVHPVEFQKQLAFLENCYHVVSPQEAFARIPQGRTPQRPSVAITFDDGYEDNYHYAYPILKEKGFKASIFLLTSEQAAGQSAVHLGEEFAGQNRLLGWNHVREMSQNGITFGSHGENHVRMKKLPNNVLKDEIRRSKEKIAGEIGGAVEFFSYPYGTREDFDHRTENFVRGAGYRAALSAMFGFNDAKTDSYALRRIGIEASDTLFTFRAKLNGALAFLAIFNYPWVRRLVRWFDRVFLKVPSSLAKEKSDSSPLLLVSVDFPPHTDGVSTISKELTERIAATGKKIIAIGPKDAGDRDYDKKQSFKTYRVPGYDWAHWRILPILFCMPYVVFRHNVRKIFAMNIAYGGLIAWTLSFFRPLEYVIFAYGYEFEKVRNHAFSSWLYRKIYARANEIVTCSEKVKERLVEFGVNERKIKVLYPAVDLGRYFPRDVSQQYLQEKGLKGRRIILTVGRLVIRKGHDKIIESLPQVAAKIPDILYCIVGIGDQEEKLRNQVRKLGLENYVRFLGRVSSEELPILYNACEVFVMPSREIEQGGHIEGFGIVFLEANACGKPVIGGRSGGVTEAIRDAHTGYLVNPLSVEEIAGKILQILSHPDQAKAMGENGLQWVRSSFNWDDYAAKSYSYLVKEELQ